MAKMDLLSGIQKKFNKFVADSAEQFKSAGQELDRLRKANERLLLVNQQLQKENHVLNNKLLSRSCTNCDTFKNKAMAAQEKLKLVYKALSPILGGNGTQQQINHMLTEKLLGDNCDAPPVGQTAKIDTPFEQQISHMPPENIFLEGNCAVPPVSPPAKIDTPAESVKLNGAREEDSYLDIHWNTSDVDDNVIAEAVNEVERRSRVAVCEENPAVINETPVRKSAWRSSRVAERIISEILGPSQPARDILAVASPEAAVIRSPLRSQLTIPETVPQFYNETTPRKTATGSPQESPVFNIKSSGEADDETPDLPLRKESREFLTSPIRVISIDKLSISSVEQNNTASILLSPSRRMLECWRGRSPSTPKRKRSSPKIKRSPAKTPKKKQVTMLKKSHRIEAEVSVNGVRKLTQTQLNVMCFKRPASQENVEKANTICETPSPVKEEVDDTIYGSPNVLNKKQRISPPLTDIGNDNSPDLDATNLSVSAVRKVASDVVRNVFNPRKDELLCTYDRLPDEEDEEAILKKYEARKRLPGQDCPECIKFYEMIGDGNVEARQKLLNECSKHRTRKNITCFTPPGFWKPMLSPTPTLHDESLEY